MICMKNLRFSSCRRQKLGAKGHRALLEHSPNSPSFSLNKSSIATVVIHTLNREIRSCVKWLLTRGLNGKLFKLSAKNGVTVAYRNRLFTRGSNCKVLTWKSLVFWMGGCFKRLYYDNTGNED